MMNNLFNLGNEVFRNFAFYGTLVLGKTAIMSMAPIYYRFKHQSGVPSIEDAKMMAPDGSKEKHKLLMKPNEDVERMRKAHLNDLENIIPFVIMSLLYISTNPNPTTALWHFRVFFASRLLHSVAYIKGIRQPARGAGFFGGFAVFWSMFAQTLMSICQ